MNKFEIIQALEGKWIPVPSGQYRLVKDSKVQTDYGNFSLLQYEVEQLEVALRYARESVE